MAVSQDIQKICADIPARIEAAVANRTADLQAQHDQLIAQLQTDHADEVAALQAALDAAAPVPAPPAS